jgi:hypothetical protein
VLSKYTNLPSPQTGAAFSQALPWLALHSLTSKISKSAPVTLRFEEVVLTRAVARD